MRKLSNLKAKYLLAPLLLVIFAGISLSACVHKPDIQQGNVVTQEMLAALSVGMNQSQVKGIVGTPLIVDPFRSQRWDYVYSMSSPEQGKAQHSYVTLFFDGDSLKEIKVQKPPLKEDEIRSMEMSTRKRF